MTGMPSRMVGSLLMGAAILPGLVSCGSGGAPPGTAVLANSPPPSSTSADPAEVLSLSGVPLEVNARVEKWVRRFSGDWRLYFEKWLAREGLYGEMIREKLRHRRLPDELVYLAMVESGFSPLAFSPAEASGMWQMVDATARRYGLRVDAYVDERRDPVRATDAALDYLDDLYRQFGSWYLAAAAYNAGEARVARSLRLKAGDAADAEGDRDLFWEIIESLPEETREYVPMMIAAMIVATDPGRYGLEFERVEPVRFERVFVPGGTSLGRVAWLAGTSKATLNALNPHLILGVTPPDVTYPVRVPSSTAALVVAGYGRVNAQLLSMAAEARALDAALPLPVLRAAAAGTGGY